MEFQCLCVVFILVIIIGITAAPTEDVELSEAIKVLQHEVQALKEQHISEQHEIERLKRITQVAQTEVQEVKKENAELRRSLNEALGSWTDAKQMTADSMFLATIGAESVSVSSGEPIVWDSAPINPGGHFNTILPMYTAPVHGYYQFSVNKEGNASHGTFWFLVDEVRYAYKTAYFYNADSTPSGSATISIELSAGQIVRIENLDSTVIYGTHEDGFMQSWFTGHLPHAL